MSDTPNGLDYGAELAAGGELTRSQLQSLAIDPTLTVDYRDVVARALEGDAAENWMLGKAIDAGALRLRPRESK